MRRAIFDRDRMNHADLGMVGEAAMQVLDGLHRFSPEQQAMGIAHAFRAVADHVGVPVGDVLAAVTNAENHAMGRRPELAAVRMYVEKEL